MSDHPSIDALHAHLDAPNSEVTGHLDGCAACRGRAARLVVGLGLIDEARRDTPVPPAWERMDEALAKEAETVARDIRSGRLRPAPRVSSWVAAGFAVAASLGLVVGGRALMKGREAPAVAPVARRVAPTPAVVPALPAYEGVVLLAAGGARYREGTGAEGVALTRSTSLREGGGVETGATGRAVFTVQSGWTADVRGGSAVGLTQLRSTKTAVTLDHGEVALAPAAGESEAVELLHGGWTVQAHGPVVARTDTSMLRVVVLAGRTEVRRGEGEALSVTGPLVVELPLDGSAPRQVTAGVEDGRSIDLAAFGEQGSWYDIPSIDPSATLTLMGHGALPSALEAVRLARSGTIQARIGRTEMRLVLDGNGTPQWAVFRAPTGPVVALNRPHAVPAAAHVDVGDPTNVPPPGVLSQVAGRAAPRLRACIEACLRQNRCRDSVSGSVEIEFSPEGRGRLASSDPSMAGAAACLQHAADLAPGAPSQVPYSIRVPIRMSRE